VQFVAATEFAGILINAKAGAKFFVGLYFVSLFAMVWMTGGIQISAFASIPIIGSAEAIVMAMLYFTIFFGHHEDHEPVAPQAVPAPERAGHRMAHA